MHNNTLANIYINTEYRTQIQQSCSTQNRIQNTQNRTTPVQHREQHTETNTQTHIQENTENNAQPQRTEQHNLVHIVLIFIIDTYISKNSIT